MAAMIGWKPSAGTGLGAGDGLVDPAMFAAAPGALSLIGGVQGNPDGFLYGMTAPKALDA
jgi:hypothetical protein